MIATSASVDVSNVNIPEEVNDAFFTKPKTKKSKKSADAVRVVDHVAFSCPLWSVARPMRDRVNRLSISHHSSSFFLPP